MPDFKSFRKDNKLSQVAAANYFNCSQGFISQIEKGIRPIPDTFIKKAQEDISINANSLVTDINSTKEDTRNDTCIFSENDFRRKKDT